MGANHSNAAVTSRATTIPPNLWRGLASQIPATSHVCYPRSPGSPVGARQKMNYQTMTLTVWMGRLTGETLLERVGDVLGVKILQGSMTDNLAQRSADTIQRTGSARHYLSTKAERSNSWIVRRDPTERARRTAITTHTGAGNVLWYI